MRASPIIPKLEQIYRAGLPIKTCQALLLPI